jgi:serine/threonine protein kinase
LSLISSLLLPSSSLSSPTGEVYRGQWRQTDVAVKRFLEQEVSEGVLEEFKAEVSLMRRLRHPNILQFVSHWG